MVIRRVRNTRCSRRCRTSSDRNFVNGLRSALNGFSQHKLLTVAAAAYPPYGDPPGAEYAMFASLQNQFRSEFRQRVALGAERIFPTQIAHRRRGCVPAVW